MVHARTGRSATRIDAAELLRLVTEGSGEAVPEAVLEAIAAALGASGVLVYAAAPGGTTLLPRPFGGCDSSEDTSEQPVPEVAARAAASGQSQESTTASAEDGWIFHATGAHRLRAVPLRTHARMVGVLVLAQGEPFLSAPQEAENLGVITPVLALVLGAHAGSEAIVENAIRAITELTGRMPAVSMSNLRAFLEERAVVHAVATMPEFDLRQFLQAVVEKSRELLGAAMVAIGVGTDPKEPFYPWVVTGVSPELASTIGRFPRPVGVLGLVAREGRIVRTSDVRRHPAFLGLPAGHPEATSFLGVPIRYKGEGIGNIYAANKIGAGAFSDDDRRVLELFGANIGIALAQSFLLWTAASQGLRISQILKSVPEGILFVDATGRHVEANPAFDRLLGVAAEAEVGLAQYAGRICWPDGRPLSLEELAFVCAPRDPPTSGVELQVKRPDGAVLPIWKRAEPVYDPAGRRVGAVVAVRDLTVPKELERLREQFAAMVAHDLRNPIQTILAQIQMLRRAGTTSASHQTAFDRIERSALRLAQMTHDLLDTARIQLSRVRLERRRVVVDQAVRAFVEQASPSLGARSIAIDVAGQPGEAWLDPARFEQILANLLENAAKYSPPGSPIEVCVAARDQGVEVAVVDHGRGIPEDEVGRLFDRFYQGRRAREAKSGLGLGLYIARGLVEAHGGRIDVESQLGTGSTFRVWLPIVPRA